MQPREAAVTSHGEEPRKNVAQRRWHFGLSYASIEVLVCVLDFALIVGLGLACAAIYSRLLNDSDLDTVRYVSTAALVGSVFTVTVRSRGLYDPRLLSQWGLQARNVVCFWLITFLVLAGAAFALKIGKDFSRGAVLLFAAIGLIALLVHRLVWCVMIGSGLRTGRLRGRRCILLCLYPFPQGAAIVDRHTADLERHGFKIDQVFHVGGAGRSPKDLAMLALAFARGSEIEEIFIAADLQRWTQVRHLVQRLCELPLPLTLLPDQNMGELFQRTSRQFGETVGIEFQRAPLTVWERSLKRTLDVVVALGGIATLTPMLLIIAVAIKLDSPGPALFKQTRRGFNSREFKIYKFRTMTVLEDGPVIKQAELNDVRITRLGRWLRKTSLDELPQLVNVLSGEMSIVGPRPHAKAHDNQFSDWVSNYAFRHHVKPGITGWAQVHGHRGETPTVEAIRKRVDLDIWYVDNWSVILDIRIIFATVVELLRGRNAV